MPKAKSNKPVVQSTLTEVLATAAEIQKLVDKAYEDELEEDKIQEILESLEMAGEDVDNKVMAYRQLILQWEAKSEALKINAKSLTDMARAHVNRAARLRQRLVDHLAAHEISKVETDMGRVSLRKGKASLKKNVDIPTDSIPKQYVQVSYDVDWKTYKADLEAGDVDAEIVELLGHLESKPYVVIT